MLVNGKLTSIIAYGSGVETIPFTRSVRATPAMHDDKVAPFCLPAVGCKKLAAAFDGVQRHQELIPVLPQDGCYRGFGCRLYGSRLHSLVRPREPFLRADLPPAERRA